MITLIKATTKKDANFWLTLIILVENSNSITINTMKVVPKAVGTIPS